MKRRALLVLPFAAAALMLTGARPPRPPPELPPSVKQQQGSNQAKCLARCQEPAEKCITRCGSNVRCIEKCSTDLEKCTDNCGVRRE